MSTHSVPCFRKEPLLKIVVSRLRRLKSENYINTRNLESLETGRIGFLLTHDLPQNVRDCLWWGSGDTNDSFTGDYNLPNAVDETSSSPSSGSLPYELLPRCSLSDSICYAVRKRNIISDTNIVLFRSVTSISRSSLTRDDNSQENDNQSIETIPFYLLEEIAYPVEDREFSQYFENSNPNSDSSIYLSVNDLGDLSESPDAEDEDHPAEQEDNGRNESVPLVTAGEYNQEATLTVAPETDISLKNQPSAEKIGENTPLLPNQNPDCKDLEISRNKTNQTLKGRFIDLCRTYCLCCTCLFKN